MFYLLRVVFTLLLFSSTYLQAKSDVKCEVNMPPVLRGFHVGETVDEISAEIPNFQMVYKATYDNEIKYLDTKSEAGFIMLDDTDVFYPKQYGDRVVPNNEYKDVEFGWHFLDGKLFDLFVKYTKFEAVNINSFVRQVAEKTHLPIQGWIFEDKEHAYLMCSGFRVEVWTGKEGRNYADYPRVRITDMTADAEYDRRYKVIELRKKSAELEKLRREKEEKTNFRP